MKDLYASHQALTEWHYRFSVRKHDGTRWHCFWFIEWFFQTERAMHLSAPVVSSFLNLTCSKTLKTKARSLDKVSIVRGMLHTKHLQRGIWSSCFLVCWLWGLISSHNTCLFLALDRVPDRTFLASSLLVYRLATSVEVIWYWWSTLPSCSIF